MSQFLGAHIVVRHNLFAKTDFNKTYRLDVVSTCNPENLQVTEQFYIDNLNTPAPYGLNQINSIGGM